MSVYLIIWIICIRKVVSQVTFNFQSTDFEKVLQTTAFVDKSVMLERAVRAETAVITAPRLFGKTTNLDMMRRFFELEVDEEGLPLSTRVFTNLTVDDTPNYRLFADHGLEICEDREFVRRHLGRYPVIRIDLRRDRQVWSEGDSWPVVMAAVHRSYRDHRYLLRGGQGVLSNRALGYIENWSNPDKYNKKNLTLDCSKPAQNFKKIRNALKKLVKYLKDYFKQIRPIVLIDHHDSLFKSALLHGVEFPVLKCINDLTLVVLETFIGRHPPVKTSFSFAAGVLDVPVLGDQLLQNHQTHRFLDVYCNDFNGFHGLTENEVQSLIVKKEFTALSDPKTVSLARVAYNGYQIENGPKIFNMYSVLNFLNTGSLTHYWSKKSTLGNFKNTRMFPVFKKIVDQLLSPNFRMFDPERDCRYAADYITKDGVLAFRSGLLPPPTTNETVSPFLEDFLLHLLLQEGYIFRRARGFPYEIPNGEIKQFLMNLIK